MLHVGEIFSLKFRNGFVLITWQILWLCKKISPSRLCYRFKLVTWIRRIRRLGLKLTFFQAKSSNFNKNPCKQKFCNCFILVTWHIFWISLKGDFCGQNPVISTISHTNILQWFGVGHMESPYSSAWFKSIFFFYKIQLFQFCWFLATKLLKIHICFSHLL